VFNIALCNKILQNVKESYKYENRYFVGKIQLPFPRQISPVLLADVSVNNCQRALVNESGTIDNQMGKHNKSEIVTVQGSPCAPISQG
jgi:hypothetical protein